MKVIDNDIWQQRRSNNVTNRQQDHRSPFQRDRARILHSAAFRRLQAKTQVMGVGQSDFYRTRLTHSLEVSQIGSGIVAQLKSKYVELGQVLFPEEDSLIESLCLAHDIGHPPFGHGGEIALNYMMRDHGGFEGNGQTFRIVTQLEPYTQHYGMNLSRRTLIGLLKYPNTLNELTCQTSNKPVINFRQLVARDWKPAKGIYNDDSAMLAWVMEPLNDADKTKFQSTRSLVNNHKKTLFKSLDCSIMELADDIAYGIHDLEDAIVTGIVKPDIFHQQVTEQLLKLDCQFMQRHAQDLTEKLFSQQQHLQKDAIGGLVNYLITAITLTDLNEQESINYSEPLLRYNAKLPPLPQQVLQLCKDFVFTNVIKLPEIQRLEYKGQQIVMELFEAFSSDPTRLLPNTTAARWQVANETGDNSQRVIADYIAGMTDEFANRVYLQLFATKF